MKIIVVVLGAALAALGHAVSKGDGCVCDAAMREAGRIAALVGGVVAWVVITLPIADKVMGGDDK